MGLRIITEPFYRPVSAQISHSGYSSASAPFPDIGKTPCQTLSLLRPLKVSGPPILWTGQDSSGLKEEAAWARPTALISRSGASRTMIIFPKPNVPSLPARPAEIRAKPARHKMSEHKN